jgi:gas vesicle protein
MQRQDSSGIVWFVAGVAIGATVALLYAPQSGEETRRRLGDKAREGRDKLNEHGRQVAERGREYFDRGRQIADEAAELFEDGRKIFQG